MSATSSILEQLDDRIPVIVGPTAVGKTSFAISLAEALNGEIISVDSRQIYRGFRIGTAQPTKSELDAIPHHIIDLLPPDKVVSAGDYRDMVVRKSEELLYAGKRPVLSGGTFLYVSAICNGIVENDETLLEIRSKIQARIDDEGPQVLYSELNKLDPVYSEVVHVNDRKRLQRAFEIYYQTGLIPSKAFEKQKHTDRDSREKYMIICLERDREILYRRIEKRVDQMMESGWLQEVKELKNSGVNRKSHAMQSVGYKQLYQVLENEISLDDALEIIKQKTRQFAKRQLTWLRKMDIDYSINMDDTGLELSKEKTELTELDKQEIN